METYDYKSTAKQGITSLIFPAIATIAGIWFLLNDYVLGFGLGNDGPTLGPTLSKVIWAVGALIGLGMLVTGVKALRGDDQQIQITDSALSVPKDDVGNEMVTIRPGEVKSLEAYANRGTRSLMIEYDGGQTKLVDQRFASPEDYDDAVARIAAFAGVPVTSKP